VKSFINLILPKYYYYDDQTDVNEISAIYSKDGRVGKCIEIFSRKTRRVRKQLQDTWRSEQVDVAATLIRGGARQDILTEVVRGFPQSFHTNPAKVSRLS
jgi:hypothetical protein